MRLYSISITPLVDWDDVFLEKEPKLTAKGQSCDKKVKYDFKKKGVDFIGWLG